MAIRFFDAANHVSLAVEARYGIHGNCNRIS